MIINTIEEFCVQNDEPLNVARVAWVGGRNMRYFQRAFTQLQRVLTHLGVGRVVLDLNALPDVSVYDQLWLSTSFMPTLIKLPLRQMVVVLSGQRIYNQHVLEGLLVAVAKTIPFDVQFFTNADAAMAWLTDDSPQLPALLAEWASGCGNAYNAPSGVAEPRAHYQRRARADCQPGS
ncbi:hypothetical protein QMK33_14020 [Hymenobacter sp. H14-R3]|uniref:hypothetical protein n=1 Tax=Hymenobacter sp. H14-R3 TaxID=3046308 RepID=UPI0024BA4C18|nr:hypothetical protein [Hymenobacter sp. H14-R3]MDJ0366272.1 hypothetical protein [Hymenobacter sp. H14-R3]